MSDVFLSYASPDREAARKVAEMLVANRWSVWWDRTIPVGRTWDEVIEQQLDSASCVVVLWSKASVTSSWVKSESAEAMRRGVLVPAIIEEAKIPLEFRRLQAADLSNWRTDIAAQEAQRLMESIAAHASRTATFTPPTSQLPKLPIDGVKMSTGSASRANTLHQNAIVPSPSRRIFSISLVVGIVVTLSVGGLVFYGQQTAERLKQVAASEAQERGRLASEREAVAKEAKDRERLASVKEAQERDRLAAANEAQERERIAKAKANQSILISPPNNSSFDHYPRDLTLAWRAVSQATAYTVEIDCYQCCGAGKWCTDVGKSWNSIPNLRVPSYQFQWVGAQAGRWRVSAMDSNNTRLTISEWWQFEFTK